MKIDLKQIKPEWRKFLKKETQKDYFKKIVHFLDSEKSKAKVIYPQEEDIFSAFKYCDLDEIKIVIIGQDPYHGESQAHGLSFSVLPGVKTPPSLRNIFKELNTDLDFTIPKHGYLESWAKQGVLLLNNVLTVEAGLANSHKNIGWQYFTDSVVEHLNTQCENIVFILWGGHAQKKGANINPERHFVLKGHHPSPLSAYRGFFGCKHFSKSNKFLKSVGREEIDWNLPELNKESSGEYTQLSF